MAKACANVQPVSAKSEEHNTRKKEAINVRSELSENNESLVIKEIAPTLQEIKEKYESTVKQKWQNKSTPIREGIINMSESTSMDDLKKLGASLEERFGIRTMQIHIHRDEGHFYEHEGITTETWMPNRHAHMVFNWTDPDTGKSIKLKREDMREFQTLVSEVLDMERGVKSSVKHLSVVEYKNKIEEEKLKLLQEKIKPLELELKSTEKELKDLSLIHI